MADGTAPDQGAALIGSRRRPGGAGSVSIRLWGPTLILLVGCYAPPLSEERPRSSSFDRPEETEAGRRAAPLLSERPGETAVYVLNSGLDAFAARMVLIGQAERSVDAQYYIFKDDVTGRLLLSRMLAAADRGVRVRLLVDDLGAWGMDPVLAAASAHENLEVRLFNPISRGRPAGLVMALDMLMELGRLNHRMHNKMLAVDGLTAVVGGRNIGDEYFDASPTTNFADLDLLVMGPVLEELGAAFDVYWNSEFVVPASGWGPFRAGAAELSGLAAELQDHERQQRESEYAHRVRTSALVREVQSGQVQLAWARAHTVVDRPEKVGARGEAAEEARLVTQIRPLFANATEELVIVSPYFIPGAVGTQFLRDAAERGVRVKILTNSLAATDVPAVHAGYAGYRVPLLQSGVELFELKRTGKSWQAAQRAGLFGSSSASLHAKSFAVDGGTIFVGSLNLDPRSIVWNTELGLVIECEELADRLLGGFGQATAPELAWQLAEESGHLVWTGTEGGEPERYRQEPDTGFWRRLQVRLLAWLPIEGQL